MTNKQGTQTLQGVQVAFDIVRYLAKSGTSSVTEISNEFNLPTSTAHIHLKTMTEAGYLRRVGSKYQLSLRFLEHGAQIRRRHEIYKTAQDKVKSVAQTTGEVASLGVEEGGKRVLLYKSEGGDAVYDNAVTGEFTYLHWVSLGKAILAHMPESDVQDIIDKHGLPSATDATITDEDQLFDELVSIRERGYAVENEEHHKDICAVAVPIRTNTKVVGAISVSGPKTRFDESRIKNQLVEELTDRANVIELEVKHY
ncbi:IclR family transcriptional regulator [Halovenus marina]|uniref:IclR family transcriptional regulator n=1 Tax=Halovenus marina TaxID=3396621 RepID=UPI003F547CE3